jgi:hypothetical protein
MTRILPWTIIFVTGCVGFPKLHPRLLSLKHGVCTEYPEIVSTDACHITFGRGIEHPIEYCEGNFAFPPEDIAHLKEYQMQECAKNE